MLKCTLYALAYALAGAVIAPLAMAILTAPPVIAEKVFHIDPAWGVLFWVLIAGGAAGAVICKSGT